MPDDHVIGLRFSFSRHLLPTIAMAIISMGVYVLMEYERDRLQGWSLFAIGILAHLWATASTEMHHNRHARDVQEQGPPR